MNWKKLFAIAGVVAFGSLGLAACDDDDNGTTPTPTPPAAPGSVGVTVNGTAITVSWAAASGAESYRVDLSTTGENTRSATKSQAETSHTFSGLTPGKTYGAQVFAINTAGQTASTVAFGTIPDDDTGDAPGAPTGVSATAEGTTVTVTFTAGSGAASHRVVLTTSGENDRVETTGAGNGSVSFSDLTEGKTYAAQVFAVNANGETASNVVTVEIVDSALGIVQVVNDILTDQTWTNDNVYVLQGPIFVGRDIDGPNGVAATLTIEPGTTILGDPDPIAGTRGAYLVVTRGSKIIADANANRADKNARPNPEDMIVFTSGVDRGQRDVSDWGGLVLNGRAPLNTGAEAEGEGDSGLYGGTDPNDNSGILRGVRVEYAGDAINAADELNGIAFQGVGSQTIVDYVQVHYNFDDGYEPYGGNVSMTHVVASGIGDDSFDGTDGYQGFMQFGIAQQRASRADNGFELSTNGDDGNVLPSSTAVIANFTMVGSGVAGEISTLGGASDDGLQLREGTNYRLFHNIITNFGEAGICIRDGATLVKAQNRLDDAANDNPDVDATLRTEGTVLYGNQTGNTDPLGDGNYEACGGGSTEAFNKEFFENANFNNVLADPNLPLDAFKIGNQASPPNFVPTAGVSGLTPVQFANITDGLVLPPHVSLVQTNYAGAVAPGTALQDAWYYGWTVWTVGGEDSRPGLGELGVQ